MREKFFKIIDQLLGKQKARALVMFLLFFLAMTIFWILKPIKKGTFISYFRVNTLDLWGTSLGGAEAEQLAKLTVVFVALLAAILLKGITKYFSFQKVFLFTTLSAAAAITFFASGILSVQGWLAWGLYVFGDVQNSLLIVLLWSLLHNTFKWREAKRVLGIVGLGSVAGGLCGTIFLQHTLLILGRETVIELCGFLMLVIAVVGTTYARKCAANDRESDKMPRVEAVSSSEREDGNLLTGWRHCKSSRYWLTIALLVVLYEATSGIIDFQLSMAVENMAGHDTGRDVYFSFVGSAQNAVALVVQLFFSGEIIRRWGLSNALLVLPLTILGGSVGFLFAPTLAGAMFLSVSDNGLNYSVNQQAKETLYLPTEAHGRFRAKAFIDLFVQRFAKAGVAILNLLLITTSSLNGVRWLSLALIPLLVLWIATAQIAGRQFETLSWSSSVQPNS